MYRILIAGLFVLSAIGLRAQNISVTGTVIDSNNRPLSNVSVSLQGSTIGSVTGVEGKYTIQTPKNGVLVFSFVGMETQEIPVDGETRIDVMMIEASNELDDIVVIGYGSMQKKQVTSSITSISAKDLVSGVGGATIATALKGKISNLVMSGTDSPNTVNDLQLRGMASVNTSRSPLIVIDGMPGGDLRSIVQEDIQSIDVLRDASAGAIYGTRATGGVILITTKRAQEGKLRMTYTGEAIQKQSFGKPEVLSRKEYLKNFNKSPDYGADTDWWEEALNDNPFSQRHLLSFQGGSESAKIYATAMYENNIGIFKGDNRTDYGGRINANFKPIAGWLDINTHIDYRQANRNDSKPEANILLALNPSRPVYDPTSITGYNVWTTATDSPNTIAEAMLNTNNTLEKWFRPDAELKFNILPVKGLSLHLIGGYENNQRENHYQSSEYTAAELRAGRKGKSSLTFEKLEQFNGDAYLSWNRNLGEHNISAVGGYSYYEKNYEEFSMSNSNFPSDKYPYWDIKSGTYLVEGTAEMKSKKNIPEKLIAYFGRANYSWRDKYMATASLRHEGSSKFSPGRQYGTFWSLSGGWRISSENFMKNITWINDLKLRVGYGETGNEGFNENYAAAMYAADLYWMMPDGKWATGYGLQNNINNDLGWEEKHEWNIGLDYSLLNDRLYGKIDLYRRNIVGLIYNINVPQPPYFKSSMYKNIGSLENIGWEIEIGGQPVKTKNWSYETSLNLSHNATTVSKIHSDYTRLYGYYIYPENIHRFEEGMTIGSFFLHQHGGFEENSAGTGSNFLILDVDGNPTKSDKGREDDKKQVGNYIPNLTAGWQHNLRYKDFQFNMTLTSWIDYDIFNAIDFYNGYLPQTPSAGQANLLKSAVGKNNHIRHFGGKPVSDYFLEDGTFLKIQNISLSYTLRTKRWVSVLETVRLYFTANNVFTFTKYSGHNPEVDITGWKGGVEDSVYPQTRTYTLGVQFNF